MAPRKRKHENPEGATDGDARLRRSTRRRTTSSLPDQKSEEPTAATHNSANAMKLNKAKPAKKGKEPAPDKTTTATKSSKSSGALIPVTVPSPKKDGKAIECLRSYGSTPSTALIFTHGAGGDLSAAAMVNFSKGFASADPEMGLIMFPGNMNVKARAELFDVVKQHEFEDGMWKSQSTTRFDLAYGGRSLGARAAVIASHSDQNVKALVLASYPLVSPRGDVRDEILINVAEDVDVLFISGDHDSMCDLGMLEDVRERMKASTWLVRVNGADHGMSIRGGKKLKEGTEAIGNAVGKVAAAWLRDRGKESREMHLIWDGEEIGVIRGEWTAGKQVEKGAKMEHITQTNESNPDTEQENPAATGARRKQKKA